jgi:hypothetical protein
MDCPSCFEALTNPYSGTFTAGCRGCTVRHLSNAPANIREKHYLAIRDADERAKLAGAVATEYKRRKALAAARRMDIVLREIA